MRLIDAERVSAVLREEAAFLLKNGPDEYGTGEAKGIIDAADVIAHAPTVDAVEVVLCGDCKYGRALNQSEAEIYCEEYIICKNSDATMTGYNVVPQQHFCSYGERRCDNG